MVHGADGSSWDRYADPEEGLIPMTVSVTARYDGEYAWHSVAIP